MQLDYIFTSWKLNSITKENNLMLDSGELHGLKCSQERNVWPDHWNLRLLRGNRDGGRWVSAGGGPFHFSLPSPLPSPQTHAPSPWTHPTGVIPTHILPRGATYKCWQQGVTVATGLHTLNLYFQSWSRVSQRAFVHGPPVRESPGVFVKNSDS